MDTQQASQQRNMAFRQLLKQAQNRALIQRSNLFGAWALLSTWSIITAAFVLLAWSVEQAWFLAIPGILLGMIVLAGRQLALSILAHEATHRTLFAHRKANDILGDWLCARPVWLDLERYRVHHLIHHSKTGTAEDTDISLVQGLPTTRTSLMRKFIRDLFGITAIKLFIGKALMDAELMKYTVAADAQWLPREGRSHLYFVWRFMKNFAPTLVMQLLLLTVLNLFGHAWLYWFWLLAHMSFYPLFLRIRSLAEHAAMEQSADTWRNTRTTRAGWIARTCVAPFYVNYHREHHLLASVPCFKLRQLHQLLRNKGMVEAPPGYRQVLQWVSSA